MSMELLKRYQEQYEAFAKIDDFNLEQTTKRVPAEKHFWVARLIDAKLEKNQLLRQKKNLRNSIVDKVLEDSPVALNKKFMDELDASPQFEYLNELIQDADMLIEYLEHVVKCVSFIAQDIKNIISLKELEQN